MAIIPLERFLTRRFGGVRAGWRIFIHRHWHQRLDRFAGYVAHLKEETKMDDLKVVVPAGEPIIEMTRTFNAPRALVWKAMSEREHITRWWGSKSFAKKIVITDHDMRVGGVWRFESHGHDGSVVVFHGEFREIDPPGKVVQTFGMEGMFEGKVIVETLTLQDLGDGRTLYRNVSHFDSIADRDGMAASNMEIGARETLDQLEAVIEELKKN
jgi:uncharacterized protein YndB with AHSA1/START domain